MFTRERPRGILMRNYPAGEREPVSVEKVLSQLTSKFSSLLVLLLFFLLANIIIPEKYELSLARGSLFLFYRIYA